jgi:hypothetical protein
VARGLRQRRTSSQPRRGLLGTLLRAQGALTNSAIQRDFGPQAIRKHCVPCSIAGPLVEQHCHAQTLVPTHSGCNQLMSTLGNTGTIASKCVLSHGCRTLRVRCSSHRKAGEPQPTPPAKHMPATRARACSPLVQTAQALLPYNQARDVWLSGPIKPLESSAVRGKPGRGFVSLARFRCGTQNKV